MATTTPSKSKVKSEEEAKKAAEEAAKATANGNGDQPGTDDGNEKEAVSETEQALEILEPKAEPRRWLIGKGPEDGGDEDTYSVYVQKPLGYMARIRFFSLVSKTLAEAIKAGGTVNLGTSDLFTGEGSIRQRVQGLTESDFGDAGSFMALAMQLISYSPEFLLECYCLWLDVPASEKTWAKRIMDQPHDPERNKWGLKQRDGIEMVEIFIDQNYEDIRDFFVVELPRLGKRVQQREKEKQVRASESDLSKQ